VRLPRRDGLAEADTISKRRSVKLVVHKGGLLVVPPLSSPPSPPPPSGKGGRFPLRPFRALFRLARASCCVCTPLTKVWSSSTCAWMMLAVAVDAVPWGLEVGVGLLKA
jgi:hypothetical protein